MKSCMKKKKKETENEVEMKKPAFRREHVKLIKLLRTSKDKKFRKEADEQESEMKKELKAKESAPIFAVGIQLIEAKLTAKGRKRVKEENFALPGRRYPIHDASHARNALARVAQHGSSAEQKAVRAAVAHKYPQIAQEGMVGNAVQKVGGALWRHKGDVAAMALGAAGAHKAGRFLGRTGADAARETRQAGRAMGFQKGSDESRGWNRGAASVRATASGIRKKMAGGKGMLAGALGALATKKAIGFAGRTALRAGKWAKRKILGEGFGSQMSGLMSRVAVGKAGKAGKVMKNKMKANQQTMNWRNKLTQAANKVREAGSLATRMAVAKGGNAGQAMRSNMKVRQTKQTLKPGWKTKMVMSIRKKFGGT